MNPFNILVNYIIANSRAAFYNVPGNQEITNTALLTGMVSENPLMSYLIIDNKAKIEGEKFSTAVAVTTSAGTGSNPGTPAPDTTPGTNPATDTGAPTNPSGTSTETPTGTPATQAEVITLEAVKNEISNSNQILKDEITKGLEANKAEFNKMIAEKLETKITFLEKNHVVINESILEIKKKLEEISKGNQSPEASGGTKDQKGLPKNNQK
ncbi:hypothetical protein [Flavobacterium salmonis]|uniref:Uncharacterized protein n=1 Tax=Flavobacterium salmonis TaxID=2654844 RepID=A0A6V6Z168_9FLAO|nr:hypothetical protein [Flavobacterium salmonis]CAD0005415.1 hypothetical protein FLAT13_02739 [Flavobacterium salmonis]